MLAGKFGSDLKKILRSDLAAHLGAIPDDLCQVASARRRLPFVYPPRFRRPLQHFRALLSWSFRVLLSFRHRDALSQDPPTPSMTHQTRMELHCAVPLESRHPLHVIISRESDGSIYISERLPSRGTPNLPMGPPELRIIQSLVTMGQVRVNVNSRDRRSNGPLHCAAMHGSVELVVVLITMGADANLPGRDGQRPLHYAVKARDPGRVVRALVKAAQGRVDVNAVDDEGNSALHYVRDLGELLGRDMRGPLGETLSMGESYVRITVIILRLPPAYWMRL